MCKRTVAIKLTCSLIIDNGECIFEQQIVENVFLSRKRHCVDFTLFITMKQQYLYGCSFYDCIYSVGSRRLRVIFRFFGRFVRVLVLSVRIVRSKQNLLAIFTVIVFRPKF